MNDAYSNRELDAKFEGVHHRINDAEEKLLAKISEVYGLSKTTVEQQAFTNGKVKKIILALVALAFFSLGLGIEQINPIISLLL